MMNVVFRVDSSNYIGTGHVMRCLTLADLLRRSGAKSTFVCRDLPGQITASIRDAGHEAILLAHPSAEAVAPGDDYSKWIGVESDADAREAKEALQARVGPIDLLIVDHYALGASWESQFRDEVGRILVIDDLANRRHDCDVLLDQNLSADPNVKYRGLVPETCQVLVGPQWCLLRSEFYDARRSLKTRDGHVRRVLVFMGGADLTNETSKALKALAICGDRDLQIDVVVGRANPHQAEVKTICQTMPNARFHLQVSQMAGMMASADLAVGGGGTTVWERCFLELPSIIVVLAPNQAMASEEVGKRGAAVNLGPASQVTAEHLAEAVRQAMNDPASLRAMSRAPAPIGAPSSPR